MKPNPLLVIYSCNITILISYTLFPGIPDPVVSLSAFPDVTSINVTWDPPIEPHGNIERYQVEYWTIAGGRDEKHSIFVINNATVLTSLLPETTYVIAVRPYTFVGDGDPVMVQSTTLKLCE